MGFFSKLFKGPEIDMEKSNANAEKMRLLFNQAVENGADYQADFRLHRGCVAGSITGLSTAVKQKSGI